MNERELIKKTTVYKTLISDLEKDTLSHAYLIICRDEIKLRAFLKYLASPIMTDEENGRTDRLILSEKYCDCLIYPEINKNIVVSSVAEIVEQSIVKPLENNRKMFILSDCQNMNAAAQNKLLKTLEEPPENVVILMGTSREYSVLPTVRSRVKTLELQPFSESEVLSVLSDKYGGRPDLDMIAEASGGLLGRAENMASDSDFAVLERLAYDIALNMNGVKDILSWSEALNAYSKKIKDFLSVIKIIFRDMLAVKCGENKLIINRTEYAGTVRAANNYDTGAIISAIDKINKAEQELFYNANANMQIENFLLSVMEGRYKWQRL